MADPLGGDIFDNEALAEAEIEKLVKQVILDILLTLSALLQFCLILNSNLPFDSQHNCWN
jgi:hypothetical protein